MHLGSKLPAKPQEAIDEFEKFKGFTTQKMNMHPIIRSKDTISRIMDLLKSLSM